jgi:hypothetical protein
MALFHFVQTDTGNGRYNHDLLKRIRVLGKSICNSVVSPLFIDDLVLHTNDFSKDFLLPMDV